MEQYLERGYSKEGAEHSVRLENPRRYGRHWEYREVPSECLERMEPYHHDRDPGRPAFCPPWLCGLQVGVLRGFESQLVGWPLTLRRIPPVDSRLKLRLLWSSKQGGDSAADMSGVDRLAGPAVATLVWSLRRYVRPLPVVFGGVLRDVAEDATGVFDVAVVPLVVGDGEEDVVEKVVGGFDAAVEDVGDVAVAQPRGKLAGATSVGFPQGKRRCGRRGRKGRSRRSRRGPEPRPIPLTRRRSFPA